MKTTTPGYTGITGTITTPTGGEVTCYLMTDGSWTWECRSCEHGGAGTEAEVRRQGAHHLRTTRRCARA